VLRLRAAARQGHNDAGLVSVGVAQAVAALAVAALAVAALAVAALAVAALARLGLLGGRPSLVPSGMQSPAALLLSNCCPRPAAAIARQARSKGVSATRPP
jgi:hypothetical protein